MKTRLLPIREFVHPFLNGSTLCLLNFTQLPVKVHVELLFKKSMIISESAISFRCILSKELSALDHGIYRLKYLEIQMVYWLFLGTSLVLRWLGSSLVRTALLLTDE